LFFFNKVIINFLNRIRVRIDTNDRNINNQQKEFKMNVYPSTTIAELRAAVSVKNKETTFINTKVLLYFFFYLSSITQRTIHHQINTFLSMVIWHTKNQL
jgi:hypothetical protein